MTTKTAKEAQKPTRSDNLNIRFEPRLRYMAGLAARHERRTLSNLIENAVESYLKTVNVAQGGHSTALVSLQDELWSIHEADRFMRLAEILPFLLTFEEEELWEMIQATAEYKSDNFEALRGLFSALQVNAQDRAAAKPTVSVGGFPFRGGRIDSSIPASIAKTSRKKAIK